MSLPILFGFQITLRQAQRMDAESICKNANDRRVLRFMQTLPFPYTVDHARQWINTSRRQAREGIAYNFGIEQKESGLVVGSIGLGNVNRKNKNAEVGYWLGKEHWRKGYTLEALHLILRFAFKNLRLMRVYAVVAKPNAASVKLLEKCNFTHEGTWRKGCRLNNRWYDVRAYGILKEEYKG